MPYAGTRCIAYRLRLPRQGALALVLSVMGIGGCSGGDLAAPRPDDRPNLAVNSFPCALSFSAVITAHDEEFAEYGVADRVDTVQVCETWTGSDYDFQVRTTGSSDELAGFPDSIATVQYRAGHVAGFAKTGESVTAPGEVGATSFDFVTAEPVQVSASYSDPYYAVLANEDPGSGGDDGGGGGDCGQSCQPSVSIAGGSGVGHGVRRRALRAVLAAHHEIEKSPEG